MYNCQRNLNQFTEICRIYLFTLINSIYFILFIEFLFTLVNSNVKLKFKKLLIKKEKFLIKFLYIRSKFSFQKL